MTARNPIPEDIYRDWRTCEKYKAQAFYCPWCQTLIEGCFAWDAKKSLYLHTSDRGVWENCPARKVQPSGRVVTQWYSRNRWGIIPVTRRERGCGKLLQHKDKAVAIGWYAYCEDCAKDVKSVIRERGHVSMAMECGESQPGMFYADVA